MACQKAQQTHDCGDHSGCHHADQYCGCINVATSAAESATSSALAAAESALLAQRVVQNCLTDSTIKPGGGLNYEDGKGIAVDYPALANNLAGKGLAASGGKLAFDPAAVAGNGLKAQGSALVVDGPSLAGSGLSYQNGRFMIDFSQIDGDAREQILSAIVAPGSGFVFDSEGKLAFDASTMDMSGIKALMKAIKQPLWLAGNTSFYVDKNHAAASDSLDEGRGLSAAKPFKTIQACWNYVAADYNVADYTAFINVASGEYVEDLQLGAYTAGTGRIIVQGQEDFSARIRGYVGAQYCPRAEFRNCDFHNRAGASSGSTAFRMFFINNNSTLVLRTCQLSLDTDSNVTTLLFNALAGSYIELRAVGKEDVGLKINYSANLGALDSVFNVDNAALALCTEINISGTLPLTGSFCSVTAAGNYSNDPIGNGYKAPKIAGSATGRRYAVSYNGICRVRSAGPEFFPGSQEGMTASGGQYA